MARFSSSTPGRRASSSTRLRGRAVQGVESLQAVRTAEVGAIGHRVVHGGPSLVEPTLIDDAVRASIAELEAIAPLHNAPALSGIDAASRAFSAVPQVAVFDTRPYSPLIAREASTYAVPRIWREDWGIRRYGFHGLLGEQCLSEHPSCLAAPKPISVWSSVTSAGLLGDGGPRRALGRHDNGVLAVEGCRWRRAGLDRSRRSPLRPAHGLSVDDVDRTLNEESARGSVRRKRSSCARGGGSGRRAGAARARCTPTASREPWRRWLPQRAVSTRSSSPQGGRALGARPSGRMRTPRFLGVELDPELNERLDPDSDVATSESAVRVLVIAAREELGHRTRGASALRKFSSMNRPDRVPPAMMRRMRPLDVTARQALSAGRFAVRRRGRPPFRLDRGMVDLEGRRGGRTDTLSDGPRRPAPRHSWLASPRARGTRARRTPRRANCS